MTVDRGWISSRPCFGYPDTLVRQSDCVWALVGDSWLRDGPVGGGCQWSSVARHVHLDRRRHADTRSAKQRQGEAVPEWLSSVSRRTRQGRCSFIFMRGEVTGIYPHVDPVCVLVFDRWFLKHFLFACIDCTCAASAWLSIIDVTWMCVCIVDRFCSCGFAVTYALHAILHVCDVTKWDIMSLRPESPVPQARLAITVLVQYFDHHPSSHPSLFYHRWSCTQGRGGGGVCPCYLGPKA